MPAVLVDTNVLVYAHDRGEPKKQRQAIQVLDALQARGRGCLPAQVVAEFFRATTRGKDPMLTVEQARQQVDNFVVAWTVLDTTAMVVQEAARCVQAHQQSYYDAQIWASAHLGQVPVVFSEDFTDGLILEGVRFVNPFSEAFILEMWLE
jgi:predicted nucleic acid-binding protein